MKKQKFKILEHISDVEFEAYGETLKEAFENAAFAVSETMTDTRRINPKIKKEINIISEDKESLLYDFLENILYFFGAENLVFSKFKIKELKKEKNKYKLKAEFYGEKFNLKKHEPRTEIKAITYHTMKIGKKNNKYFVHVLVDI